MFLVAPPGLGYRLTFGLRFWPPLVHVPCWPVEDAKDTITHNAASSMSEMKGTASPYVSYGLGPPHRQSVCAEGTIAPNGVSNVSLLFDVSEINFQGIYTADVLLTTNAQPIAKV